MVSGVGVSIMDRSRNFFKDSSLVSVSVVAVCHLDWIY